MMPDRPSPDRLQFRPTFAGGLWKLQLASTSPPHPHRYTSSLRRIPPLASAALVSCTGKRQRRLQIDCIMMLHCSCRGPRRHSLLVPILPPACTPEKAEGDTSSAREIATAVQPCKHSSRVTLAPGKPFEFPVWVPYCAAKERHNLQPDSALMPGPLV